jgi:hypothetical protein
MEGSMAWRVILSLMIAHLLMLSAIWHVQFKLYPAWPSWLLVRRRQKKLAMLGSYIPQYRGMVFEMVLEWYLFRVYHDALA